MATYSASDGARLSYTVTGDAAGEPVLFLHGFPLSSALWVDVAGHLTGGGVRCIVPDLRGHGASEVGADGIEERGSASLSRFAHDAAELLDEIGERRPVTVVGMSMGGYTALEFYRLFRGRVRALVLANTRANADTPEGARAREIQALGVLREGSAEGLAETMAAKLFSPEAPEDLRSRWRGIIAGANPRGVAFALRAMASRPDSTPTLTAITVPRLIIVGQDDQITPPDVARGMHERVAGSRLEVASGAGHMTPVERPEWFAGVLRSFVQSLAKPGA